MKKLKLKRLDLSDVRDYEEIATLEQMEMMGGSGIEPIPSPGLDIPSAPPIPTTCDIPRYNPSSSSSCNQNNCNYVNRIEVKVSNNSCSIGYTGTINTSSGHKHELGAKVSYDSKNGWGFGTTYGYTF